MKFIIDNWMLIAVAIASASMLLWPMVQGAAATGLGPAAAVQLINREKGVVIDVCDPAEFAAGHVGGAKNIPLSDLENKLGAAVKNKALPLILVCQTGGRSGDACKTLEKMGYTRAHNLSGGIAAWRVAGLPLKKGS